MDKKLLSALENLSFALEAIAEALEKTKKKGTGSDVAGALASKDLDKKINLVQKGIQDLKNDNKKILQNQETLLKLAKEKKDESVVSESGDPKKSKKLKEGLGIILAIALGVMAIGLAFKIVGEINFVAVLSLAVALPLIAYAFEKIAEVGEQIGPVKLFLVTVAIAISISTASHILSTVKPINLIKLFSALAIAGVLVALSYGLGQLMEGISKIGLTSVFKVVLLPLVFYFLSLAIAQSSEVLTGVTPVGLLKLFSAILIAGVFAALAFSLEKITSSLGNINVRGIASIIFLPLIFVALSQAIAYSSEYLREVKPVNLIKLLNAIFIAAVFAALGYGLGKILDGFKGMDPITVAVAALLMPTVLVSLSEAIAKSSEHLREVMPVNLVKLLTAFAIGVVFIPLAYAVAQISKAMEKVSIVGALLMPVILVTLAGVIWLTSIIFEKTTSIPYEKLLNILTIAGVISAIAFVFAKLTQMALTKISVADAVKGAGMLLLVAATIMITSWLLNKGTYEKYPNMSYAAGVGASLAVFGLAAIGLGMAALTGVGGAAFLIGLPMVVLLANTIVSVSGILAGGSYNNPGMLEWAVATSLLYATFTPVILVLAAVGMASAVVQVFTGKNPFAKAREMVVEVAQTIVDVSKKLKEGDYTGGPTMEWAGGVAIAIGAFSPLYAMLLANKIMSIFRGGGIGPDDFNKAITTVVGGIMFAAKEFAGTTAFQGGPKKEWAEGVGGAIGAFSLVYKVLADSKGGFFKKAGPTIEEFNEAIKVTVQGIITAATEFSKNSGVFDLKNVPKKEWAERVGGALNAFAPALEYITKNAGIFSGADPELIGKTIKSTAMGIYISSITLSKGNYEEKLKKEWVHGVSDAIQVYVQLVFWLYKRTGLDKAKRYFSKVASDIVNTSFILAKGKFKKNINVQYMDSLRDFTQTYVNLVMWVNKRNGLNNAIRYFNGSGGLAGLLEGGLGEVAVLPAMLKTARVFNKIGKNLSNLDPEWMINVEMNVKRYVRLARWLTDKNPKLNALGNAVYNMYKIADGYSQLAKGVSKLNTELKKLDVEKLSILKNLTGSIVLMSLMDADQFKKMMDALEKKAKIFVDVMSATDKKKPKEPITGSIENVRTTSGSSQGAGKTFDDVCKLLDQVILNTGSTSTGIGDINKFIDELKTGTTKLPE